MAREFDPWITCGFFIIIVNILLGCHLWWAGSLERKAEAWEARSGWRQTSCKVLAAGVSCADEDASDNVRRVCAGYKAGSMPSQRVPVFLGEQIAMCPGTYWCAKEQELCTCTGEIIYSPKLFDGYTYTSTAGEAYKVRSEGTWKCGTDQQGQEYADPAPGEVKHCWCTPKEIQEMLQPFGADNLHKEECAEASHSDYQAVRRLGQRVQLTPSKQFAFEEEGRQISWSQNASEKARQLTSDDTSYRYSPWALVTIDEFNEFEPSSSSSKPITCAYEFGVPEASGWMDQDELFLLIAWLAGKKSKPSLNGLLPFVLPGELYQSGGAYQPELWEAEAVAKEWGREPVRPCWVRTQAASAAAGEYCATALKMPGTLAKTAASMMKSARVWFWSFFSGSCLLVALLTWLCWPMIKETCESMRSGCLDCVHFFSPAETENLIPN
ncbi:unnamed protein product [Effrenium voratum]|nr:unnamed protein product [Effrenium voratum]